MKKQSFSFVKNSVLVLFKKTRKYMSSVDGKAIGFIFLVILTFFTTRWVFKGAFFTNDLVIITTPLENLYSHIQRSGQSPLWAGELAGGYPLLGTGQLGFWYPPHMLLRQFFPAVWTLNLSLLLHSLLAGFGTFIFLRLNKINISGAIIGALLLPLGGAFVGKYEMINLIMPFTWAPLLLFFLQLFSKDKRSPVLIYWIITNTLCILMGHPQMAVYILILEAVFVICILLLDWRTWLRALTVLCGVFLIVGLTLPYTLPILDVFPSTERANGISADKNGLFEFEFTAQALKGLILSHPFGHGSQYKGAKNESELSSYLGPVAIILAFIGLFIGRKKFPILWLFSVLISSVGGLLAFGGYSPVYRWLIDVGLRYFNAPARFFLFTDIGLVFLASIGLYFVTTWIRDSHSRFVLTKLLIFTIVAPVVWVSWFWYEGVPWQYTKEPAIAKVLAQQNTFTRVFSKEKLSDIAPNNNFGITLWDSVCSTCLYRQSFNSPFNIMNGIKIKFSSPKAMGVITIKLFDDSGKQLKKVSLSSNEVNDSDWTIFAFSDLEGVLGKSFYFELTSDMSKAQAPRVFIHTNPKNEQYDPTGALSLCQKNSCTPVLADFNTIDIDFEVTTTHSNAVVGYELLTPYIPVGFGIGTAQWAGSLEITDVDKYLAHLGDRSSDSVWEENRSLVNRFPITHVIGLYPPYRYGTNLHDFKEIASVPLDNMFIRLYQNNQAFSRIHFVQHVQAIQGSRNQQKELLKLNPQDQETVVASVANNINFISGGSAKITEDQRTTIAIQTENPSDGFLVLRDVVLPGWIVRIDGKEIPSILTDSLFRGIKVPAGSHKVTFQYSPRWLKIALIGELLSLTLLVVLIYCTIFHKQFKVIKRNL